MNIFIDSFHRMIRLGAPATKKTPAFFYEMKFDYPLDTQANKKKALNELIKSEIGAKLTAEKSNSLLTTDEIVGFGTFEFPPLSKWKVKDVFNTRFKICYPSFEKYCVQELEYDRSQKGSTHFYTFAMKESIDALKEFMKKEGVAVSDVDYFAHAYVDSIEDNTDSYPVATLVVGENDSELIISKDKDVYAASIFGYGTNALLDGDNPIPSAYYLGNRSANQYSGFTKENFRRRIELNDENIMMTDPAAGISYSKPRELRVLKDEVLQAYCVKSNFRKFIARIIDVLNHYSSAPLFMPFSQVHVIASDEVFARLESALDLDAPITFVRRDFSERLFTLRGIKQNRLFDNAFKKERRKIDWSKILNMEIGKKKKA